MSPPGPPIDIEPDRRAERRHCLLAILATAMSGAAATAWVAAAAGASTVATLSLAGIAGIAAGLVAARLLRLSPGLPVLTYHSVSEDAAWLPWRRDISIRPATLDRQLRLFRRMGLRVTDTETAVRARLASGQLPADAVALHFDDGYLDTWVAAAPILRRWGACATVFVSTDFVAPDQPLRPTIDEDGPHVWDGYMSWRELRQLEASGTFRVEAHGTDHGRVVTGPRVVDRLGPDNSGRLSWVQWALMPGDKHDWYRRPAPPVPMGSPVRESAPALSARGWAPETGQEGEAEFVDRVRGTFADCIAAFRAGMGRRPVLFCWPQNRTCARARALAAEAGFLATTGGRGRNVGRANAAVIGRVHVGEDYAGFRCGWIDDLAVRAQIRCFQGHVGWSVALAAIALLRAAVRLLPRTLPRSRAPARRSKESAR